MKRIFETILAAALVLGSVGAVGARAEEDAGHHHEKEGRQEMVMAWGKKLGLTDAQIEKMKAAAKAHWEATKPLRRELRDENLKLRDLMEDKAEGAQLTKALDRIDATRRKLADAKQKFKAALASILDPMQRAHMELMTQERMRRGALGRHEHKGRRDWGRKEAARDHDKKDECAMGARGDKDKQDPHSWHHDDSPAKETPQSGDKEGNSDPGN